MRAEPNAYSHRWFEFFHVSIDKARTTQETAFICRCAPLPEFRKVLDICCGMGRHARSLSEHGYVLVGVDRDGDIIRKARSLAGSPSYVHADIRNYRPEPCAFDLAIVMSQSFGYFDSTTNRDVLERLVAGLRDGGRFILDLWNYEFFVTHQGERKLDTGGEVVRENKRVEGDRLFVKLKYPGGGEDQFEWQLFSLTRMISMAESVGLARLLVCTDFDEKTAPSSSNPRVQFLFERRLRISNEHQPIVTIDYLSDRDGRVAQAIAPRCSTQLRLHCGQLGD